MPSRFVKATAPILVGPDAESPVPVQAIGSHRAAIEVLTPPHVGTPLFAAPVYSIVPAK